MLLSEPSFAQEQNHHNFITTSSVFTDSEYQSSQTLVPYNLTAFDLVEIVSFDNFKQQVDQNEYVSLQIGEVVYQLSLEEFNIHPPGFKASILVDGEHIIIPKEKTQSYIGSVVGTASEVIITISEAGDFLANLRFDNKNIYVERLPQNSSLFNDRSIFFAYDVNEDLVVDENSSVTFFDEYPVASNENNAQPLLPLTDLFNPVTDPRVDANIIVVCDQEFYDLGRSDSMERMDMVMAGVISAYRQVNVNLIPVKYVCDTSGNYVNSTGNFSILNQLKNHWKDSDIGFDLVLLLSGKNIVSENNPYTALIGQANPTINGTNPQSIRDILFAVLAIDNPREESYAVAQMISESAYSATYDEKKALVVHELGHLFGAIHEKAAKKCHLGLTLPPNICILGISSFSVMANIADNSKSLFSENYTDSDMWDIPVSSLPHIDTDNLQVVGQNAQYYLTWPEWFKTNAGWWHQGNITNNEFVEIIEYLIEENYIHVSTVSNSNSGNVIPNWVKTSAGWWSESLISDNEFDQGIVYLIQNGIIRFQTSSLTQNLGLVTAYEGLQVVPLSTGSITPVSGSSTSGCEPNCYSQSIVSVDTGSTVTFSNSVGNSTNTFTSGNPGIGPDGIWNSGLLSAGQSHSVTLNTPGTYQFYSMVRPWMQGSIIVGSNSTNLPPTANAGTDQIVYEQTLVVLSGTGTDPEDQGQMRYTWRQTAGPTVLLSGSSFSGGSSNSQSIFFTAPDVSSDTILTFSITVKDSTLQAGVDTVSVTVRPVVTTVNNPPTGNAGPNKTYNEGDIVTLDGSGSSDPDSGDTLSYLWQQLNGRTVSLSSATSQSPTFTAPQVNAGMINLQFKLLVRDSSNAPSPPDYVTITVSDIPIPPSNNAPVIINDLVRTTGTLPIVIDVLFNDSDPDGDTISVSSINSTGTNGTATNNGNNITFVADESFSGTTSFTYVIADSHGAVSVPGRVTVDVYAPQDSGDARWVQTHPDFVANGHFGFSVDVLDNGNVVAGAPDHWTSGGSITVLDAEDGSKVFTKLNPQNTADDFGWSLASLGNSTVVGAPLYDAGEVADAGAVYVYDSGGTLAFPIIVNPTPSASDKFGFSVAASTISNKIFVGAPSHDIVTLNLAESNAITQAFVPFAVQSDNSTAGSSSVITDLSLVADVGTNSIRIVDSITNDTVHVISDFVSYNPVTLSYNNTIDSFVSSAAVLESEDDVDYAGDVVPPVLVLNHTANTMSLNDGTTGAVLVTSSVIPNGNTTTSGIDTLSELPNDLILFSNELTQTSYVFDKATGLLILTEFRDAGAVYVYNGTTGDHIAPPITPPNVRTRNNFGSSIDTLANGNLIVGDKRDYSPDRRSGAVHVFDGVTKSQLHYLQNLLADIYSSNGFGTTVASAGNYIVVGAPNDSGLNNTGPSRSGAIYVYDGVTGSQKAYLPAATYAMNADRYDEFGDAVAGSPDGTMILGASRDSEYVLVFSFNGMHVQLTKQIDTPNSTASSNFGYSLAVTDNNSVVVGDRTHQPLSSGAVFLFDPPTSTGSNTSPVAVNDDSIIVQEDSADNVIRVLANDSDADDDTLAIDSVNLSGTHGTAVISGNNTVLFTPTADYAGTTAFSYRITDGNGGFSVGTVTVTVSNVNDRPASEDDYATTAEEQAVTIPVLDNDSDIDDGDVLYVHSVNVTNTAGTVINNNSNTVTFTPSADFNGDTSFTYVTADDDGSLSAPSSVLIIITPVNDAPVAVNDDVITPEDTPIVIPVLSNDYDVDVITAQLQAAESTAAFDAYRDWFALRHPPVPGTVNANGVFVAYSDQLLSEITSHTSSLPVSADNSTQNKSPPNGGLKPEINEQRDAINQLKQEKK